jgi:protein-tyrosine phosphatase
MSSAGASSGGSGAAVLFVCTGNVARSPAAELLMQAGLGGRIGLGSAGLGALVGEPVAAPMGQLLRARGIDPRGFVARQLDLDMVGRADLMLTMTAAQRAAVVSRAPAAVRRTFLLAEFADLAVLGAERLVAVDPAERLRAAVGEAARMRARRPVQAGTDDIEDPYQRPPEIYARVFERIERAVNLLLSVLTASSAGVPTPYAPASAWDVTPQG